MHGKNQTNTHTHTLWRSLIHTYHPTNTQPLTHITITSTLAKNHRRNFFGRYQLPAVFPARPIRFFFAFITNLGLKRNECVCVCVGIFSCFLCVWHWWREGESNWYLYCVKLYTLHLHACKKRIHAYGKHFDAYRNIGQTEMEILGRKIWGEREREGEKLREKNANSYILLCI